VAFPPIPGAYAEYIAVPSERLIPLPGSVDWIAGAAAPLQGMTAHYLVHAVHAIRPGETVLIHAAAGGVGQLFTQMAKRAGARVIGTVSTPEKARVAREAGADEVINYREEAFAAEARRLTDGRGVDVVYDSVGKATFARSLAAVRDRGHVVIFGSSSGPANSISPNVFQNGAKTVSGATLQDFTVTREELLERADAVFGWLAAGALKLRIERILPLAEAAEAHRLLESRQTSGKLVLTID
jgi:NADPH2:quinone reductase